MQLLCPACARPVVIGLMPPGGTVSCPHCQTVFRLPSLSAPPAAVRPQTPGNPNPALQERLKRRRRQGPWVLVAWAVFLLACLGGVAAAIVIIGRNVFSDPQPVSSSPKSATPEPRKPAAWHKVKSWSGEKSLRTQPFRIASSTWRINWFCTERERKYQKSFNVYLYTAEGKLISNPITSLGDGRDTTWLTMEPGHYSLEIKASDMRWELMVEDQR